MAILPVYITSKLHAVRINLRQTPSSTPGVLFNYVKEHGFWPNVGVICTIFHGRASTLNLTETPLHEILDPPLLIYNASYRKLSVSPI